jgi:hypothetical protein
MSKPREWQPLVYLAWRKTQWLTGLDPDRRLRVTLVDGGYKAFLQHGG